MSIASTLSKQGKTIQYRKMLGTGGTYNPATGVMGGGSMAPPVTLKAVLDGFGSVESQLRSGELVNNDLIETGRLRVFSVVKMHPGDIVTVDGEDYTVVYNKTVYKKEVAVLFEAVVRL